jgi:hypothetical protein
MTAQPPLRPRVRRHLTSQPERVADKILATLRELARPCRPSEISANRRMTGVRREARDAALAHLVSTGRVQVGERPEKRQGVRILFRVYGLAKRPGGTP